MTVAPAASPEFWNSARCRESKSLASDAPESPEVPGVGVAALSADRGKAWIRATVPPAFASGKPVLVPGLGLAVVASAPEGRVAWVILKPD